YRWQPAVTAGQRLLTDIVDEETGVRGYALSRDPAFRRTYEQNVVAERTDTTRLRALVGADARLRARLADLDRAVRAWHQDVATPAIGAGGAHRADSPAARQQFASIRAESSRLDAELVARTREARAARVTYGTAFVVALAITVGLLIAAGGTLWRGLHRWVLGPIDRLGAQTREVSSGQTQKEIVAAGPVELTMLGHDVETMRRQIATQLALAEEVQEELRVRGEELARSNDDLQQFAYVASHDLSEPLRKVANFCQLLERQYGPELDDRARQYIDFAVDGAKRMQVLITDLLALSRVGRTTERFVPVDLETALDQAIANLGEKVATEARIERATPLPTVAGDRSLLTSLLENLVGNALKYRRDDVEPVVVIRAERDPDQELWTITVADNGIGIDPQYGERIFAVFQRLHLRDSYGGTGIGLALCRKIVEFHGGRIWLADVESGPGATFRFTIPEGDLSAEQHD
ncbi:MAG TPA: ATP-binding protein, partial [Jatrophihabitans sp.]|nr:ATP-binding protein [Jatrophihabitans sp.]